MNFVKFLRTSVFKEHLWWLLLKIQSGFSLVLLNGKLEVETYQHNFIINNNGIQTHNHLVRKQSLNDLAELASSAK